MGNASQHVSARRPTTVHPHVHGERNGSPGVMVWPNGSSPRTWGTLNEKTRPLLIVRFIPTYMGNATRTSGYIIRALVHPHVHGERIMGSAGFGPANGSSPRTWGTLVSEIIEKLNNRFIPTYMGNAVPVQQKPKSVQVHPHVHGERSISATATFSPYGSSPRTWGTHLYH